MKTVKKISAEETYPIRKEILRKNIDLPYKFNGDLDEKTFHLGAFLGEELVGIASFMQTDVSVFNERAYQLRGMATIEKVRGEGLGSLIIDEASRILVKEEISLIWCNAREVAVKFYERNGFSISGDCFDIAKVGPHYKMIKKLS